MRSKITKAIIPAAGFGTRFLPASKAIPKVMFPVIDKPIVYPSAFKLQGLYLIARRHSYVSDGARSFDFGK